MRPDSSASAHRLIGTGLLAAGPTAWTGWPEWSGRVAIPPTTSHRASDGHLRRRDVTRQTAVVPGRARLDAIASCTEYT